MRRAVVAKSVWWRRVATAAYVAIATVLLIPVAQADEPALTVALDWRDVSQRMIDRCRLSGLENLLLEALIEQGFAVVADTGQQQVTLTLRTTDDGLAIEARRDAVRELRHIGVDRSCDSTIAIEIIRVAKDALRVITMPPPAAPAPEMAVPPAVTQAAPVAVAPAREPWRWGLALGVASVGLDEPMPTLRVELARDLPGMWVGAAVLGTSAWHSLGLWIVEPTAGLQLRRRLPFGDGWELAAGASADLVAHAYKYRDSPTGALLNGRVGVPLELTFPQVPLVLGILPNVRFRQIRQSVFEDVAFESGWFACDVVLKWVFD